MPDRAARLRRLSEVLAALYDSEPTARRLARDAGLDPARLDLAGAPAVFWQNIVYEAERQGRIPALLDLAGQEYPEYADLAGIRPEFSHIPALPSPYRGLEYFDIQHADIYFGRAAMVDKLLVKLQQANFLVVVGPSGSGKSSLVRAGLLPALGRGALAGSAGWTYDILRPGADPLRALAAPLVDRLTPALSPVDRLAETRKLADHLAAQTVPMADVLAGVLANLTPAQPRLLLIVDQFEEAFTLCTDEQQRRVFFAALTAARLAPWLTIILTLRADFYGRMLADECLSPHVDRGLVNVMPMTPAERREAIERPALEAGARFEEGLVERILDAVAGAPGDLPLLQFALTELWQQQTGDGRLTHAAYEDIGGVAGALEQRAEMVYARFTPVEQAACRRVFLRLTQPDEDGEDTARRAPLGELLSMTPGRETIEKVILQLASPETRLIIVGGQTNERSVELAHEALVRNWARLREWIDKDREALHVHRHLTNATADWLVSAMDEGLLYRGNRLERIVGWIKDHGDDPNQQERAFVDASIALREHEGAERTAFAEERALAARHLARRNRIIGTIAAGALVVAVLAVFLGWLAVRNQAAYVAAQKTAETKDRYALSQQLIAQAKLYEDSDPGLALLLAVEAVSTTAEYDGYIAYEADTELRRLIAVNPLVPDLSTAPVTEVIKSDLAGGTPLPGYSPDGRLHLQPHTSSGLIAIVESQTNTPLFMVGNGMMRQAKLSPDGARMVTIADKDKVDVWSVDGGKEVVKLATEGWVHTAVFTPDGQSIITNSADLPRSASYVQRWNADSGRQVGRTLAGVKLIGLSPDGAQWVGVTDQGKMSVFEVQTGHARFDLNRPAETSQHLTWWASYSPDGRRILARTDANSATLWDAETGESLRRFSHQDDNVVSGGFSDDGERILTIGITARVWDADNGELLAESPDQTEIPSWGAFAAEGQLVVIVGANGATSVWNTATQGWFSQLEGTTSSAPGAAFSPDRRLYVTVMFNQVFVWDLLTYTKKLTLSHLLHISRAEFGPDGQSIVTVSNGRAHLWNLPNGTERAAFGSGSLAQGAFSPDGRRVVSGGEDGIGRVWDVQTAQEVLRLDGHRAAINWAGYSRTGDLIVTAGEDATVRTWDAQTGEARRTLDGFTGPVNIAVIGPNRARILTWSYDDTRAYSLAPSGTVGVWDVSTGSLLMEFETRDKPIKWLDFSPDDRYAMALDSSGVARIWELDQRREVLRLQLDPADWAMFSADSTSVLSGSQLAGAGHPIQIWQVPEQARVSYRGHNDTVYRVGFLPAGELAVSVGGSGEAFLWETRTGAVAARLMGHGANSTNPEEMVISGFALNAAGDTIATAGWDRTVRVYGVPDGAERALLPDLPNRAQMVLFLPASELVAVSAGDLLLWNIRTGSVITQSLPSPARGLAVSADGRLLASAGMETRVWDISRGSFVEKLVLRCDGENGPAFVQFSPDGSQLAVNGLDGVICVWDVLTGRRLATLDGQSGMVWQLAYHPNGKILAAASDDGKVRLWDIEAGREVRSLAGHIKRVTSLAFSPDGSQIASGGQDGTLRLWNTDNGELQALLTEHSDFTRDQEVIVDFETGTVSAAEPVRWILTLSYDGTGTRILAAGGDGKITSYLADPDRLVAMGRRRVTRSFTCEERVRFLGESMTCPTPVPGPTLGSGPTAQRLVGTVTAMDDSHWSIGAQVVRIGPETVVVNEPGLGDQVSVSVQTEPDGSATALHVEAIARADAYEQRQLIDFITALDSDVWTLGGVPVRVDGFTSIEGDFSVGDAARVQAESRADGQLWALAIRKFVEVVEFTGVVESLSSSGWQVAGRWFHVDATTLLTGESPPEVGMSADVKALGASYGLSARQIHLSRAGGPSASGDNPAPGASVVPGTHPTPRAP